MTKQMRLYALCFVVWIFFGLFLLTQDLTRKFFSGEPTPWWHYLVSWLIGSSLLALLTPTVFWLARRLAFERRKWPVRLVQHLLLSIAFALVQLGGEGGILHALGVFPGYMKTFPAAVIFLLIIGFHQTVLTYWMLIGIQHAWQYYRRYQEREKEALRLELRASELQSQLTQAQLGALKMQLQPHFLFNTLNAITVLVRQRKSLEAEHTIAQFSDLLRLVLDDVDSQEIPLRRELTFLKLYLSIEEVRFQDRLRVEIETEPATLDANVPHMILQPIVENAIRHGIGRSSSAGHIVIQSFRSDDQLQIIVKDDGPGLPPDFSIRGDGIGLANTRARLRELYGTAAQLKLDSGLAGGTIVTILLPYHCTELAAEEPLAYELEDADRR
jgi:two-component system LytT family sensor kinase